MGLFKTKTKLMTSIEWLMEQIEGEGDIQRDVLSNVLEIKISVSNFLEIKRIAKEMEKQQIIDAFWNGDNTDCTNEQNSKEFAEQYYQETFVSKGSDETLKDYHIVDTNQMIEISDEEIENVAWEKYTGDSARLAWVEAIKWYREQLKQNL
jgi:hypothetical protein